MDNSWGMEAQLDCYGCDPALIRDKDAIEKFAINLCDLIDMKRFGECQVVHFGEDERVAGYSMLQLIETSLVSAHFANQTNAAYINVFSCKEFNPFDVKDFVESYFGASRVKMKISYRE